MYELHTPVLLEETLSGLLLQNTGKQRAFVDATAGLGGHSQKILERMDDGDVLIFVDRDGENLEKANELLSKEDSVTQMKKKIIPIHSSFALIDSILEKAGVESIDGILYDLGVSSVHYDDAERGFSIRNDGPLDMRFDRNSDIPTASELLSAISEEELRRALQMYADEPKAFFIAKAIIEARNKKAITSTEELAGIIKQSSFDPKSSLRVFQAIRILVNKEFEQIEQSIPAAVQRLRPGGRLAVITFHSIEDRLVKTLCKELETPKINQITGQVIVPGIIRKITKKPIEPTEEEIRNNPRSRSAKLRIYEKN